MILRTVLILAAALSAAAVQAQPPDDGGKWQVALFYRSDDAQGTRLAADLAGQTPLREYADASRFNYSAHDLNDVYQRAKFAAWKIDQVPTLVVSPPQQGPWPYCYVVRRIGYDGDAAALAGEVRSQIEAFLAKYPGQTAAFLPWRRPVCPGPDCPNTPGTPPLPSPAPVPIAPAPIAPAPVNPLPQVPPVQPAVAPERDRPVLDAIGQRLGALEKIAENTAASAKLAPLVNGLGWSSPLAASILGGVWLGVRFLKWKHAQTAQPAAPAQDAVQSRLSTLTTLLGHLGEFEQQLQTLLKSASAPAAPAAAPPAAK